MSARLKSPPLSELTSRQVQWIVGGFAMTFATMPGQTIFIAQFNTALRETYGLSHGAFGGLYTVATLASAFCLVFAGVLADRFSARGLALASLGGLSLVALLMASQNNLVLLVLAMAGLRFFGQGMLSHIAMTTMSRWFNRFRGRALSFAGLGFSTGESMLPFTITLAIAAFGWRQVWFGAALVLLCIVVPAVWFLFRDPPDGKRAVARGAVNPDAMPAGAPTGAKWTRGRVLRDPLFYLIVAGTMAPPAIGTLFIFHQAQLAALKGWDLTVFTAFFPVMSASVVSSSILAGFLVDRFGAWRLIPLLLLPLGTACLVIATMTPLWAIPLFLAALGGTTGLMSPVLGALWAEVYGTAHLGAVRSLATAALVSASAIGPGFAGLLIDLGIELSVQAFGYAAYCFGGAVFFYLIRSRFRARVGETARTVVTAAAE